MAEPAFEDEIYNQTCFHAHQAIEKALKACLEAEGKLPPRTHKIADLMARVRGLSLSDLEGKLLRMDRFYIPTRYPDDLPGMLPEGWPGREEALEALELAREVLRRVETLR
ncbi:HEPN domain-containing protein [Thermoflexus hugenholtzii]